MSTVYEAFRKDGAFQQRVAIKILKRFMYTDGLLLRFRSERQIMAGSGHPHIARLPDGGAIPDRRPYFVMEYIDGTPITSYCDQRRLNIAALLDLFLQVMIHRDIKPDNVLVTEEGAVNCST